MIIIKKRKLVHSKKVVKNKVFCHILIASSNIFITLVNSNHKVLWTISSGSKYLGYVGKNRRSLFALDDCIKYLVKYLYNYKITGVRLVLKGKYIGLLRQIVYKLNRKGVKVLSFYYSKPRAHNGVRAKRKKRY